MQGIAASHGVTLAFQPIFSIHGETLHNPYYENEMKAGDIAVNDAAMAQGAHEAPHQGSLARAEIAVQVNSFTPCGTGGQARPEGLHRLAVWQE